MARHQLLRTKNGNGIYQLSRLIKKMEEKGLIYREKNPDDGRGVLIKLTDFGKEKRETSKQSVLQFNNMVKNTVPDKKLQTFFEVTETIHELVSNKLIFDK